MNELNGKRIMLVEMFDDPNPIPSGTMGTIRHVGGGVINVDWDCGRSLGVVEGVDRYRIME
jgi:hypothetical protein